MNSNSELGFKFYLILESIIFFKKNQILTRSKKSVFKSNINEFALIIQKHLSTSGLFGCIIALLQPVVWASSSSLNQMFIMNTFILNTTMHHTLIVKLILFANKN